MRTHLVDLDVRLTMTWIWLGFLAVAFLAYGLFRYWRRRHPVRPPEPKRSYSELLADRMASRRLSGEHKRRRDKPKKHRKDAHS